MRLAAGQISRGPGEVLADPVLGGLHLIGRRRRVAPGLLSVVLGITQVMCGIGIQGLGLGDEVAGLLGLIAQLFRSLGAELFHRVAQFTFGVVERLPGGLPVGRGLLRRAVP